MACDLVRGAVRLYYAHDFDRWATIDIVAPCEAGRERVLIEQLLADASTLPSRTKREAGS